MPSVETLFVATFGLLGLRLGLRPLGDNSLFIHLRTGIDMVRTGSIPRTDPYSFTAAGEPWVVQSWLASASYGVAERAGGLALVRIEHGLLYGLLALTIAALCRTGNAARTALAATLAIGMGVVYWSPRPLAFGLAAFALTVYVVERRKPWWTLVPIVWVWVNSHGSFALGLAWLVLLVLGQRIAGQRRPEALPWLGGFALGLVVSSINPLGARLLTFPIAVLAKREAFSEVAEWRPPAFLTVPGALTLVCLLGVVLVVARCRPSWPDVLPLTAFLAAGLVAQRNLPMAAIAAAPVLARSLRASRGAGAAEAEARPVMHVGIAGLVAALGILFVAVAAREPALVLDAYPVEAARLYDRPERVATTDIAAGYLILTEGKAASVLFDDRVDMYPLEVTRDYLRLLRAEPEALDVLDRHGVEVVLWPEEQPLDAQLAASSRWRRVGTRDGWAVWARGEP